MMVVRLKKIMPWAIGGILLLAMVLVGRAAMLMLTQQAGPSQVRFTTGTAQRGPIQVLVTGTGTTDWIARQGLKAETEGVVADVLVNVGDRVKEDQILIRLTNDDNNLAAVNVVSPTAGRIINLKVKENDTIQKDAVLATIADSIEMVVPVIGSERQRIRSGQEALVRVDDFDGEVPGRVLSVGNEEIAGDSIIYYEVRIGLGNPGLLKAGMSGQASINTDSGMVLRRGSLAWAAQQPLLAPIAGRVDRIEVVENQGVRAGTRIARIVNDAWSADNLTIRAPFDGIVTALHVRVGDSLSVGAQGGEAVAVSRGDSVIVTVSVDELDVAGIKEGEKAEVFFSALPEQTFEGRVERVAMEGKSQNGVTSYDVEIAVPQAEGVRAGMTATASIEVAAKADALLIPVEAVIDTPEGSFVRISGGGQPHQVAVKIGLRNDSMAEVISGLREEDQVILAEFNPTDAATQGLGRSGPGGLPIGGMPGGRQGGFGRPGAGGGGER